MNSISRHTSRWSCLLIAFSCTLLLVPFLTALEKSPFDNYSSYLGTNYDQEYRPKFHFTSRKNWINDPNGLLYYDGEYHLFFQHNPLGTGWGNMTWGHAISTDMVHWQQMEHAILPYGNGYVFSGTGVVDHNNSLGVQKGDTKTLVLLYSYAVDIRKNFGILPPPAETCYYQGIAYSTDKGRTFTLLNDGAPVIPNQGKTVDPKGTERDPKLFWHEESKKWITILWLGETSKGKVRFFTSDNLRDWAFASDMQRPWAHECFDLVHLDVYDDKGKKSGNKKWLIYDGNLDYEVGNFDGKAFHSQQKVRNHKIGHWNAAQTFNNSPDDRTVIMGWLVQGCFYRKRMPFAEQLSFPTTMHLRKQGADHLLCRWPVDEIKSLYTKTHTLPKNIKVEKANQNLKDISADAMDITLSFEPKAKDLVFHMRGSTLTYQAKDNKLSFLSASYAQIQKRLAEMNEKERKRHRGKKNFLLPDAAIDGVVNVRILIDRGSFEIFLNGGVSVLTQSEISELDQLSLFFSHNNTNAIINELIIHELESSWK
ncbi:MAG: glycoside hydrolase family 32 protein [Planctomycetes bacterium]|nr:glycoside hydrolase family 32 protein [Planctomycetota bacterium]